MIEISQQNVAAALTVAIQALVVGGLVACIVVGSQGGSSLATSPSDGVRYVDSPSDNASPAAYPVVGGQPDSRLPTGIPPGLAGGNTISFSA